MTPVKYKDFVFEEVQVRRKLPYRTAPTGIKQKYYCFDFYEAKGDSSHQSRPVIIWLHGGGFKFGNRRSAGIPIWARTFAQRGYACASVGYRLSSKHPLKHFEDLVDACADAMQDLNDAIRYFKAHAAEFRIDTNRIILAGNSAGGMLALQSVYSSPADLSALIHRGDSSLPAGYQYNQQHIAAIFSCWGAIFNLDWLTHARVPIVSVHGRNDHVVPIEHGSAPLYGSLAIHRKADALHIPNQLKIFEGYSHELQKHFNPLFAGPGAKKRWREAGQFAAEFLYTQLFTNK